MDSCDFILSNSAFHFTGGAMLGAAGGAALGAVSGAMAGVVIAGPIGAGLGASIGAGGYAASTAIFGSLLVAGSMSPNIKKVVKVVSGSIMSLAALVIPALVTMSLASCTFTAGLLFSAQLAIAVSLISLAVAAILSPWVLCSSINDRDLDNFL